MQQSLQRKYNPVKPMAPTVVEDIFVRLKHLSLHARDLVAQQQRWSMPVFYMSIRDTLLSPTLQLTMMGSFAQVMDDYSRYLHERRHQLILALNLQQQATQEDRSIIQWLAMLSPRERKERIWDYFLLLLNSKQAALWTGKEKADCMFLCKHLSHLAYTLHVWYYESLINCSAHLKALIPDLLTDIEDLVITFMRDHLFKIISELNDLVAEVTEDYDPPLQEECQETGRVIEAMISKLYPFNEAYTSRDKGSLAK